MKDIIIKILKNAKLKNKQLTLKKIIKEIKKLSSSIHDNESMNEIKNDEFVVDIDEIKIEKNIKMLLNKNKIIICYDNDKEVKYTIHEDKKEHNHDDKDSCNNTDTNDIEMKKKKSSKKRNNNDDDHDNNYHNYESDERTIVSKVKKTKIIEHDNDNHDSNKNASTSTHTSINSNIFQPEELWKNGIMK